MPLSNAERKRCFRDRLKNDPDMREQFQEKDRQRWHERKILEKVEGVKDMTDREHRRKIQMWKEAQNRCKANMSAVQQMISPPQTPEHLTFEPEQNLKSERERGRYTQRSLHRECSRDTSF